MRLKEILRTEYIGAITIGFLAAQGVGNLVGLVVGVIGWWIYGNPSRSVFAGTHNFDYSILVRPGISAALYFLTAYGVLRWLYTPGAGTAMEESKDAPEA